MVRVLAAVGWLWPLVVALSAVVALVCVGDLRDNTVLSLFGVAMLGSPAVSVALFRRVPADWRSSIRLALACTGTMVVLAGELFLVLFSRFDAMQRLPVLNTTGVVQILGSGDRLEPVDADEIEAIRKAVTSGFPMQPCTFLKTGQKVHIHDGPLIGLDGIIEYQKAQCRLVLSVTLLQRSVTVEIDQSWVRPIPSLDRPGGLARRPVLQTYSSHF